MKFLKKQEYILTHILDKKECTGCCACIDACPCEAITLQIDIEGFWYPQIDNSKCIDCNLCKKICPEINIDKLKVNDYNSPKCYAAIHTNMHTRWDSTSGGVFSALAEEMYDSKGYVSGAIYNADFSVSNLISDNPVDLAKLRSSKYLQSNSEGLFQKIENLVREGKNVLACGTPCQMVALRSFLGKEYENLIIIDFICRGVNSPKVYRKYLDTLEEKYKGKVISVKAKSKEFGWRNLTRKVIFENGKTYNGILMEDDFRRGYHTNAYCRPSCYHCKHKGFPRIADITLGDFWGIEKVNKNLDNNIGTSLVLINSLKGEEYFNEVKCRLEYIETDIKIALSRNPALLHPINLSKIDRAGFFSNLDRYGFSYVAKKYFPYKKKKSFKIRIRTKLKMLNRLYRDMGINIPTYIKFIRVNFRKNTLRSKSQFLFPLKYSILDIHSNAKIEINKNIYFGLKTVKGSRVESRLKMEKNTTLIINEGPLTRYGDGPYILRNGCDIQIVNEGRLTLGQGACNTNLTIICASEISIGNGVRIGRDVTIRDWNGPHVIVDDSYSNHAPVDIGDNVWICSNVTIMPGVSIGAGAIIASGAVVTKNIPDRTLAAGIPAKVIKENIEWY